MNRRRYLNTWRRYASIQPRQLVLSIRNPDRIENGVIIPGVEFAWYTVPRYKRPKR